MNPTLKNVLAVIAGIIAGMIINMGIVMMSGSVIPLPDGVDPTNVESLKENIHLFQPKHFIFPFLAHAIGTLAGAYIAARLSASHGMQIALGIAVFFMASGIANVVMLPSPMWFNVVDLILAYIPMGWLGGKWGTAIRSLANR